MAPLITKNFWLSSRLILLAQRGLRSYPIFSAQKKYFTHLWNKEGETEHIWTVSLQDKSRVKSEGHSVCLELQKGTINSKYLSGIFFSFSERFTIN